MNPPTKRLQLGSSLAVSSLCLACSLASVINPAIVDGQVRGGVAQGIGAVLLERSAYDEFGNLVAPTICSA